MFSGLLKLEIRVTYRVSFHLSKKSTLVGLQLSAQLRRLLLTPTDVCPVLVNGFLRDFVIYR